MYQVRGSLARRALIELMEKGLIKQVNTYFVVQCWKVILLVHVESDINRSIAQVVAHSSQMIYTRMIGDKEEDDKEAEGGVVVSFHKLFPLWRRI